VKKAEVMWMNPKPNPKCPACGAGSWKNGISRGPIFPSVQLHAQFLQKRQAEADFRPARPEAELGRTDEDVLLGKGSLKSHPAAWRAGWEIKETFWYLF